MKFDTNGKLLKKWGNPSLGIQVPPANAFYIPHSVTLAEDKKEVCVADRENGRVQCFDYDGKFLRKLKPKEIGNRLFAISYSPKAGQLLSSLFSGIRLYIITEVSKQNQLNIVKY